MQPTFKPVRTGGPGFSIFLVCFLLAACMTLGAWIFYKRGMATPAATPPKPAATTNNNPLARASQTLGAVSDLNKEGADTADNLQSPAAATPTPTPTASATPVPGLKLQGIFFSANNPSAIINGKSMKVGDEADGIKVLEITQQMVRIQRAGEVHELRMK